MIKVRFELKAERRERWRKRKTPSSVRYGVSHLEQMREARRRRHEWKEERHGSFDFRNNEYQRLWNLEIGAEAAHVGSRKDIPLKSWAEYCTELAEWEKSRA